MKRVIIYFVCLITAFIGVYVSGYGNLTNNVSESLAVSTYVGFSLLLAFVLIAICEVYIRLKATVKQLTERLEKTESEYAELKAKQNDDITR